MSMNVDEYYPYDPSITFEERMATPMPRKLCGFKDREIAQAIFDGWRATNRETAERLRVSVEERPRGGVD